MLAADGSLNAHHCAVGGHTSSAKNALGTDIGEPPRAENVTKRLLAGRCVGNGNKVQNVHVVFGLLVLTIRRENAQRHCVRPVIALGNHQKIAHLQKCQTLGAVAARFGKLKEGCGVVHCRFWVCCCCC